MVRASDLGFVRKLTASSGRQACFREHQPWTFVAWGKNDPIFPAAGRKRDLKNLEFHLLETGHFAFEEDCDNIADLIRNFL